MLSYCLARMMKNLPIFVIIEASVVREKIKEIIFLYSNVKEENVPLLKTYLRLVSFSLSLLVILSRDDDNY